MEEFEARGAAVLAAVPDWLWDGRAPVPVEDIADSCFGLRVRDVEDMSGAPGAPSLADGESLSGLLLTGRREIWVNAAEAREWPARRRFTISHELGHWVLHRGDHAAVFCRHAVVEPPSPDPPPPADAPFPALEAEANAFAAALLMPADLVRRHYHATGGNFEVLRERFGASGAAMSRRLRAVIPPAAGRR